MSEIKLIAIDLDGTLLNTKKELSDENLKALYRAAEAGIEIVPATGRFFDAMPAQIRSLPFLHYAITINGAQVYDCRNNRSVSQVNIGLDSALRIMDYLDTFPVIYDCYIGNRGWMYYADWDRAEQYINDPHVLNMVRKTRQPVEKLKCFLEQKDSSVQKISAYTTDERLRQSLIEHLGEKFPDVVVTSSLPCNIEINHADANKGNAIRCLTEIMGITQEQTMAIGDGLNDLPMIDAAGIGVAMENGHPMLKSAADFITDSCNMNGVATAISHYLNKISE